MPNNIQEQTEDIKARIWWLWVFFILSILAGVYSFNNPNIIGIFCVTLTFLVFNGIMLLYKIIIMSVKRIREELKCPSPIQQ